MLEEAGVRSRKELIDVVVGSCVTSNAGPYGERNCTRDGGGPFGFGNQVLISSHRKLLRPKSHGGERCGNAGARFRQARSREASASEPLQKCRKRIRRCQNRGVTLVWGLFCQGVSGGRRVFLCSIGKPVSSSRPALRSRRRAQELSRLAVAPTLQHGPDHTLTASSTTAPWCGRDDDQRGARFRARINRATTLYPVGSKDPEP